MAKVIPFRGILYNPDKVGDFSQVVAPPYDVIDEDLQNNLCERHPYNIVRLILGEPGENAGDSKLFYQNAAERFRAWQADQTLVADPAPALYFTSVEFTIGNTAYVRYGIIGYVHLEPFANRVILPHERTSSKVKTDRLNLMQHTSANFCQIFSLYADPEAIILTTLQESVAGRQPDIDLVDDSGERHKLWRITDQKTIETVSGAMAEKRLYIADGHHRYETALNYKDWVAQTDPDFSADHSANYVMMYMSATADPGLVILPTHRLLPQVDEKLRTGFVEAAAAHFDITAVPVDQQNPAAAQQRFLENLREGSAQNTIGAIISGQSAFYLLTPKPNLGREVFGHDVPEVLRRLDVTVLTRLILINLLGFTQAELDEEKIIDYTSDFDEALEAVRAGQCDMAFILNATKNEQMRAVAAEGEIMPRKTTFYYPKVLTGLVLSSKRGQGE